MAIIFNLGRVISFVVYTQYKRFVWAISNTNWYILLRAEVALHNETVAYISGQGPVGAGQYTVPAPDAFLRVNGYYAGCLVLAHGSSKAKIDTPRFSAMTALNGEANLPVSLHADARQGARSLSLERLNHILGQRMFRLAVDPTKATANTYLLAYVDSVGFAQMLTLIGKR
jgi:hypothetical protein